MGSARDQTELCIIQMSKGNDGRKYKIIGSARASAYFCLRLIRRRTTAQLEIKRKQQTSLNEITEVTYGSSLNLRVGRIERKTHCCRCELSVTCVVVQEVIKCWAFCRCSFIAGPTWWTSCTTAHCLIHEIIAPKFSLFKSNDKQQEEKSSNWTARPSHVHSVRVLCEEVFLVYLRCVCRWTNGMSTLTGLFLFLSWFLQVCFSSDGTCLDLSSGCPSI